MNTLSKYNLWIGTLGGFTNADVRAHVTGYLLRQGYQAIQNGIGS